MKFLVPNYSCLQNLWLGGYRPQIPVLSILCPQLNLLNPPRTEFLGTPLGTIDPLHIRMHPLGLYEISKKNLPPSRKKKCATHWHIHALTLLKRLGWKELIFRNVFTCKVLGTVLLFNGTTAPRRPGLPRYRSFTITLAPHSVVLLWTSDRPVLTTHGTHTRQTSMPPAGNELAIPASEQAAGIGAVLKSALCNSSDGFVVLTEVLFTFLHT